MRARVARWLVRCSARGIDRSYREYVRAQMSLRPERRKARRISKLALRVALKVHNDAAAGQMCEEGWWG